MSILPCSARTFLRARPLVAAAALAVAAALPADPLPAQGAPARPLVFEEALRGSEDREVRWPVAVAAASADEIAVADAFGPRLLVFRKAGVGWQAAAVAELPGAPVGLARLGERWVVALRGEASLVALEGESLLQRRLALPPGTVPGPVAAAASGGGLLVADAAAGRILRLAADGAPAGEIAVTGTVTGLAPGPGGGAVAAFGAEGVVRRYDAAGALQGTWELPDDGPVPAWPSGVAVSPGGDTLVADRHNGRIVVFEAGGRVAGLGSRKGWDPGLLLFPEGLALLPDGRLLVADQGNGRLQLFRRSGGVP